MSPSPKCKPWSTVRNFAFRSDVANTLGADGLVEYSCEENNRNVPGADPFSGCRLLFHLGSSQGDPGREGRDPRTPVLYG